MIYKNHNLPTPLHQPGRPDAKACRDILANEATVEDATATLSTSEVIAVALAFGREELLPMPYTGFRSACRPETACDREGGRRVAALGHQRR